MPSLSMSDTVVTDKGPSRKELSCRPLSTAIALASTSTPALARYPNDVRNGDFIISPNPALSASPGALTGDGVDEVTTWTFNFSHRPKSAIGFPNSSPLQSALLTLTLTPRHALISTDVVRIRGLSPIDTPIIQGLTVNVTSTVEIELLDFYASADILAVLVPPFVFVPEVVNHFHIPMLYQDDAIVTYAQLELTSER